MVRIINLAEKFSEEEMSKREGDLFNSDYYDEIIDEDCDAYDNNGNLIFKLRKGVIAKELTKLAIDNYKKAAQKKHENRGASAGPLDKEKMPNYIGDFVEPGKFRTHFISNTSGKLSNQHVSNLSPSNIIGYFDKRDRNLGKNAPPCRTTAFTSQQVDKWTKVIPLIQNIDLQFKRLIPKNHRIQYKQAQKTKFVIKGTAFSTVTINHNWRTALHKDAGDLKEGFGNFPICMAKTQYSFTTDPTVMGAPTNHSVPIKEVKLSAGAGFVIVICGDIMSMPGLPKKPSAENIDINEIGMIKGLF